MNEDPETGELKREQADRAQAERERADEAGGEEDTQAHERRAEKADYLRRKLQQRADAERDG